MYALFCSRAQRDRSAILAKVDWVIGGRVGQLTRIGIQLEHPASQSSQPIQPANPAGPGNQYWPAYLTISVVTKKGSGQRSGYLAVYPFSGQLSTAVGCALLGCELRAMNLNSPLADSAIRNEFIKLSHCARLICRRASHPLRGFFFRIFFPVLAIYPGNFETHKFCSFAN